MKTYIQTIAILLIFMTTAFSKTNDKQGNNFQYEVDKFADLRILRYQVPGFEELTLQQKKLI